MKKKALFLWAFLWIFAVFMLVIGAFCLFFNYFFISLFSLKNCIGISLLLSLYGCIANYNDIKTKIDRRLGGNNA